ncbi:MAG: SPOR domain-containing protein [Bacteroidetes bacterium]|nr:SPOR domain-containing protein [Bacteroidota bacterium]
MKQRFIFYLLVFTHSFLFGQVAITVSLPDTVTLNTEIPFTVIINKSVDIEGLCKYQMEVDKSLSVKLDESRGGTFSFDKNHVKIIWGKIPTDTELVLKLILVSGNETGEKTLSQTFEYLQNDERKEVSANPVSVFVKEDSLHKPAETPHKAVTPQQATQLKKDAKEAYRLGTAEKQTAEDMILEANKEIKKAEKIKDEDERSTVLAKAQEKKQKAENDKTTADKILALAKALEKEAYDIEHLSAVEFTSETMYYIQIGAFTQNPDQALIKHLKVIKIVQEDSMYKVLYGKFTNKEDALNQRLKMIEKGFTDCFVVTYKNGQRVK